MNNLERARDNELEALIALVSVGYLTTRQLGAWVYPNSRSHTQVVQAQRLTKRLQASGHITKRNTVRGAAAWVLSSRGAFRVRSETNNLIPAIAGYGLRTDGCNARHWYAVEYLTTARTKGDEAIGRAGLRVGLTDYGALQGLDGVVTDHETGETYGIMVITNAHEDNVNKYTRLRTHLPIVLLGVEWAVKQVSQSAP
jgi:hypothetical protein